MVTKLNTPAVYHVITHLYKQFKLLKQDSKRAIRVYNDGVEMRNDVAFYLFNRNCKVYVHNKNGEVTRVIDSTGQENKI